MGRFPWTHAVDSLEAEVVGLGARTRGTRHKQLSRVGDIFEELRAAGKACVDPKTGELRALNPQTLTEADVKAFLDYLREKGYVGAYSKKLIRVLEELLTLAGNNALAVLRVKRLARFPSAKSGKDVIALDMDTVETLLRACDALGDEYRGALAKAAIAVCAGAGLRSSEARLQHVEGVDFLRLEVRVTVPKGLGVFAKTGDPAPLMDWAVPVLRDWLDVRDAYLRKLGADPPTVKLLFPFDDRHHAPPAIKEWSETQWRNLARKVRAAGRVPATTWKALRASFGQIGKDAGAPIEVVSKGMRHSSTAVTEGYYARVRSVSAFNALRVAVRNPVRQSRGD